MLEKARPHDSFFSLKGVRERPVSVATEFMESEWAEDEVHSEFEEDGIEEEVDNSPRASVHSVSLPASAP